MQCSEILSAPSSDWLPLRRTCPASLTQSAFVASRATSLLFVAGPPCQPFSSLSSAPGVLMMSAQTSSFNAEMYEIV
eukprot:3154908-Karenia_brevis.AAC.1